MLDSSAAECDTLAYRQPQPDRITLAIAHGLGNTYYDADSLAESLAHTLAHSIANGLADGLTHTVAFPNGDRITYGHA